MTSPRIGGGLSAVGKMAQAVKRPAERVTFALAEHDRPLQNRRPLPLMGNLSRDVQGALLVTRPKHVAQRIELGFAQPLGLHSGEDQWPLKERTVPPFVPQFDVCSGSGLRAS